MTDFICSPIDSQIKLKGRKIGFFREKMKCVLYVLMHLVNNMFRNMI